MLVSVDPALVAAAAGRWPAAAEALHAAVGPLRRSAAEVGLDASLEPGVRAVLAVVEACGRAGAALAAAAAHYAGAEARLAHLLDQAGGRLR